MFVSAIFFQDFGSAGFAALAPSAGAACGERAAGPAGLRAETSGLPGVYSQVWNSWASGLPETFSA